MASEFLLAPFGLANSPNFADEVGTIFDAYISCIDKLEALGNGEHKNLDKFKFKQNLLGLITYAEQMALFLFWEFKRSHDTISMLKYYNWEQELHERWRVVNKW